MSEFRQEWPVDGTISDYRKVFETGIDIVKQDLILPEDGRFENAAAALVLGGTVLAYGEPGVAKTRFGEIVIGSGSEIPIQSDDTRGTLVGYKRPTDGGFNSGSIDLDGDEAELFFDEVSHLGDNTEALNQFWNSKIIRVNGRDYDLSGMSIYGTSNFPEKGERRVKPIGRALLSRFGMSVVVTAEDAISADIQQKTMQLKGREDKYYEGILPPREVRKAIKSYLAGTQEVSDDAGQYVTDVALALNNYGILRKIHKNDGRIGEGWATNAVASRFAHKRLNSEKAIEPLELAQTAALSIGTLATLHLMESIPMQQELKNGSLLDSLEKAVFERRLVTATAFVTAKKGKFETFSEDDVKDFMDKYSYVEADDKALGAKMDETVLDIVLGREKKGGEKDVPTGTDKRNWFRRGNK